MELNMREKISDLINKGELKMNKKCLSIIITGVMLFSLVGCASNGNKVVLTSDGIKYTQNDINKLKAVNTKLTHWLKIHNVKIKNLR